MLVKKVSLTNFRNYRDTAIELDSARNVLLGENAQGKTNFLEAIELISLARSDRAQQDADLICKGSEYMKVEVIFEARGQEETASYALRLSPSSRLKTEKQVKINSLTQKSARGLRGRLVTVGFKSADLNLLRSGPKFRRDWIDDIQVTLRPAYEEILGKYLKIVAQRNRLLKMLFEKGRLSVSDQDELKAWDQQLTRAGARIIKERMRLLFELLPRAEKHQEHISGQKELLSAQYIFRAADVTDESDSESEAGERTSVKAQDLAQMEEEEISGTMIKLLAERRYAEISRKQTLVGPHRDDIRFYLNGANAVDFASQGQQRSLVLSLKLAELEAVRASILEPPVLLLDDVLAELDLGRQGLLMSLVASDMQTLITTTHLTGFRKEWVEGALFLNVSAGTIQSRRELEAVTGA